MSPAISPEAAEADPRLPFLGELERRALALQEGQEQEPLVSLLTFYLADEWFALPLEQVKVVTRLLDVTPVPGASPYVLGVINHKSAIYPLINVHQLLKIEPQVPTRSSRFVIFQHDKYTLALLVDNMGEVREVRDPRWSPGGSSIVFRAVDRAGRNALGVYDADHDRASLLVPYRWAELSHPSFASDSLVLFTSTATATGRNDVFALDVPSGEIRNLTQSPEVSESEPLLVQGRLIYLSDAAGVPRPVEHRADGLQVRQRRLGGLHRRQPSVVAGFNADAVVACRACRPLDAASRFGRIGSSLFESARPPVRHSRAGLRR